jgi:hypothetical protein
MNRKSGLADSPFFTQQVSPAPTLRESEPTHKNNVHPTPKQQMQSTDFQSYRPPEYGSYRLPDQQSTRVTDFQSYSVPNYQKMQRIEVRLTWEQNKFLDDLEAIIARDAPEGERSDPNYRRITKNSIIRALVEIVRCLEVQVDARSFRSEKDLLTALVETLKSQLPNG